MLTGNSVGWQMLYLNQVIQRHLEEEETLLQLCQDETLAELQEAAQHMTTEEQQKRLCELSAKRQQLDLENQGIYAVRYTCMCEISLFIVNLIQN